MKISLNKIKSYINLPTSLSDDELVKLIGSRLVEVEEVVNLAPKYKNIHIVKVVSAEPIPETHLSLCQIDAGYEKNQIFSDTDTIQVVCGAPNVHAGMLAVWIAPGAIVPATYGNENFRLSVRKLRGYESHGMLAAADELDLGSDHGGIVEIAPHMAAPGANFAETFGLNDLILDVENKSLTHRPDCFGLVGFAREVAGILGLKFVEPPIFASLSEYKLRTQHKVDLKVKITNAELCPRYSCAVFDLPDNKPSKYLTHDAVFLAKAGMRAIDPMVDLTNILMLETGQPLHAFDYDKLIAVGGSKKPQIIVRPAEVGEEIQLLDGKTIKCCDFDILITSNNVPVALAGAMGGKNTEIDASTKRVILESATFSLYHLRKTQMSHGIFSEAITRFTKGQPAALTYPVLAAAVNNLGIEPLAVVDEQPVKPQKNVVKITETEVNQLLGTSYDRETIIRTLENVGFRVNRRTFEVTAPAWRTDIHIKQDIIEEVGRLLGYDNIPLTLPEKPFLEAAVDPIFAFKQELREILSNRLVMNELLTYSFVSRDLLHKVGQSASLSYEIVNSISPELQCFRQQIVPSLLDKVRENIRAGHQNFTLYEMNQVSSKPVLGEDPTGAENITDTNQAVSLPVLRNDLGIVHLGDFYSLKALVLTMLRRELKVDLGYMQITPGSKVAMQYPYLEPSHSAALVIGETVIGAFGEVRGSVLSSFKLEPTISALELSLDELIKIPRELKLNLEFSKFPAVERDLTLKVAADSPFWRSLNLLEECFAKEEKLTYTVTPLSVYQATPDDATKNLSFHLKFASLTKTLSAEEISAIMDRITVEAAKIGAKVI